MRRAPVLIIGGGPAGSAAAITLARAGVPAELIERTTGDHECVCGGFMSADALCALESLGVDPAELGARPIGQFRLVAAGTCASVDLPFRAAGLSRRTLDSALLGAAARAGARVRRGTRARIAYPGSLAVQLDEEDLILCDALFLATGKHELRGTARRPEPSQELSVGLRAELPGSSARERALAGRVELHLFDHGYAGLLLQDGGSCNLCLSVARERLTRAGSVAALVGEILSEAPLLGDRIGSDLPSRWEAVAGLPYGWSASDTRPGLFRIGDQGAVIASLVGDGLAIALTSGLASAHAFLGNGPEAAQQWQRRFTRRASRPIAAGELLRRSAASSFARSALMAVARHVPTLGAMLAASTRIAAI
jgi:flavin-dependent dehydrogenase